MRPDHARDGPEGFVCHLLVVDAVGKTHINNLERHWIAMLQATRRDKGYNFLTGKPGGDLRLRAMQNKRAAAVKRQLRRL